jgi:hypothetical protein
LIFFTLTQEVSMFSRISFLFVMILLVLGCSMVSADTAAPAAVPAVTNGPWYVAVLISVIPTLVVYLTSQIRSHMKDGTIERLATGAQKVKQFEPLAQDALAFLESKYPVLKQDVQKVETIAKDPVAQVAIKAAEAVATNLTGAPQA